MPAAEPLHQIMLTMAGAPDMSVTAIVAIIIAIACLFLSGFISASEIAYFSLTPSQLDDLDDTRHGAGIRRLLNKPEQFLATILIANNLVNVTIVVLTNFALGPLFNGMSEVLSFILQSVILTFLILLFGEILPKLYSSNYPEKWACRALAGITFIYMVLAPAAKLLAGSSVIVNRIVRRNKETITGEELSQALELTADASSSDKEILEGILKYGETQASEIMTPRVDITDIPDSASFSDVMKIVIDSGYARMPVYHESQDNICGILFARDLLPYIGKVDDNFDWRSLLREPFFVPESRMIDDLLEDFRTRKQHLAIVVDEFGGTCGIVTLEDVLEEIVGDIDDEYDTPDTTYRRLRDNTYEFEGRTLLNDFFRITDLDEADYAEVCEDAETLAGMLLAIKGDFPKEKESLVYGRCRFLVLDISDHRITGVRVKVMPDEQTE